MQDNILADLTKAVEKGRLYKKRNYLYDVNKDHVGKKYFASNLANDDYHMGRYVSEKGVSVPEYKRFVRPDEIETGLWYIIMQKINNGKDIFNLKGAELERAIELYEIEIEKVLSLGICPHDTYLDSNNNVLFDPSKDKVYLIDFEGWCFGPAEGVIWFREKLESL